MSELCFLLSDSVVAKGTRLAEQQLVCEVKDLVSGRTIYEVRGSADQPYVCFFNLDRVEGFESYCNCQDYHRKVSDMATVMPMVRRCRR